MDNEKQTEENTPVEEIEVSADTEEKSTGAIIGVIIIVVLLALGGLYFLGQRVAKPADKVLAPEEILSQPDVVIETLDNQGTSDKITDIQADLVNESDFGNNLDIELGNIDAEISAQ